MKIVLLTILTLLISACSNNYIDAVKQGKLLINPDVTIEQALESYRYFGNTHWALERENKGSSQIKFTGVYDFNKFIGAEFKAFGIKVTEERVKELKDKLADIKISYIAIFEIQKSSGVLNVVSSYINISGTHHETGEKVSNNIPDKNLTFLQTIYKNEPELSLIGLLK